MPKPTFDQTTGWWYFRWRDAAGRRVKTSLGKDPRWKEKGQKIARPPADILLIARKYQDAEIQARHGVDVTLARKTDLAAHLAAYAESYAIGRANNSIRALRRTVRHFRAFCASRGIATLQAINVAACRGYLDARMAVAARGTVVTEKGLLAPIWTRAVEDRLVADNPWRRAKVPGKAKAEEPPYWTEEELARLVDACEGWLKALVVVGVNCGLRITSLLTLEWDDVKWQRGVIAVRAAESKSSRRYEVPISESARDVLQDRHKGSKGKLVFPSPRTGDAMRAAVPYKAMRLAVRRAGLPEKGSYNHILRHTFATHAIARGIPLAIVSKWLGHATIHMTMKYAHMNAIESQAQMARFDLPPPPAPPRSPSGGERSPPG